MPDILKRGAAISAVAKNEHQLSEAGCRWEDMKSNDSLLGAGENIDYVSCHTFYQAGKTTSVEHNVLFAKKNIYQNLWEKVLQHWRILEK